MRSIVLAFFALFSLHLNAVMPTVYVLTDGIHYRYLLSDIHYDYIDGRNTRIQHKDILWALQQKKPHVFLLAEDMYEYSGPNKLIQEMYDIPLPTIEAAIKQTQLNNEIDPDLAINSFEVFNLQLTSMSNTIVPCRAAKIPCFNIECGQSITAYEFGYNISREEVINELSEYIDALKSNKKVAVYSEFLVKKLEETKQIALVENNDLFLQQSKKLLQFLMDARALHKLSGEASDVKHVFVCAGAYHIEAIKENLENTGYKTIKHIGLGFDDYFPSETTYDNASHVINNAIDLRKTFVDIFAQQRG